MNLRREINRRYVPVRLLGQSNTGEVYLVRDRKTGIQYKLKDIRCGPGACDNSGKPGDGDKGSDEGKLLRLLSHPGIPMYCDSFCDNQRKIIVTEYIEGNTLWEESFIRGGIDEEELIGILIDICDILAYIHGRDVPLIYRDLKPGNIMLGKNGGIYLIDFGSAVNEGSGSIAEGTGYYASPEHFSGRVDRRSDIFSLGKTALRVSANIRGIPLSVGFMAIIKKATEDKPSDRYQNIFEMREALIALRRKEL